MMIKNECILDGQKYLIQRVLIFITRDQPFMRMVELWKISFIESNQNG